MNHPGVSPTQPDEPSHSPGGPAVRRSIPVGWVVAVIAGALIALIAIGPLVGGGFLLWANATQRDDSGFFTTSSQRLETTSYAITSEKIDLGANPADRDTGVDLGDIATLRLDVAGTRETPTFVGIGPTTDVDRYLNGVAHAEVDRIRFDPFAVDYQYAEGGPPPSAPSGQAFWVSWSVDDTGNQSLVWQPESGNWSVVIMNANANVGVSVDASLGVKTPWVFRVGIALIVGGALGLLLGASLLVVGVLGLARGSHIDLTGADGRAAQPVRLEGRLDQPLNRWLWLVKWLLLIPHFVVLAVLWIAFALVTFIAFFAILFTERYPKSLFDFNAGVLRWTWRVTYYGYSVLGTDRYPPFSMGAEPDYPATLTIARPERLSRGLVLVKWWLLAIPQYLVLGIIGGGLVIGLGGAWRAGIPFGGFLGLLVLFAAIALLFTGQYPRAMFDLVMGLNRWVYRVITYAALMRDEYPPFRLDQGGTEPAPDVPPSVPPTSEPARRGPTSSPDRGADVNASTSTDRLRGNRTGPSARQIDTMTIDPIRMLGRHHRPAVLLVAGSLFIGSACSSGLSRDITTRVEGTISAGPTCPVEREGQPCAPSPIPQTEIEVLAADGRPSAHAASDDDGRFSVLVAPGRYTLHVALDGAFPLCPDTAVTVPDEGTVGTDIVCDTGIR